MPDDPKIADELQRMKYEPLIRAEKVLIITSLAIGLVLLFVFVAITRFWPTLWP